MSLPENAFRAGAGAVIINSAGQVLALERAHIQNAWQLADVDIRKARDLELSRWKWISLRELARVTVHFRRSLYEKLADGFSQYHKD